MPYTNPWDETFPLGSAAPSNLDNYMRRLMLDIRERMNTILDANGQWDDDPIVLDTSGVGSFTAKVRYFPPYNIMSVNDEDNVAVGFGGSGGSGCWFVTNGAGLVTMLPLELPSGIKITRMECLIQPTSAGMKVRLFRQTFATNPVVTAVAVITTTAFGSVVIIDTGAGGIDHTVLTDSVYWIENDPRDMSGTQTYKIYGYRLTLDVPGISSLI